MIVIFFEVLFTRSEFKHLTGISSDLSAVNFYELCIGMKTKGKKIRYIGPNDIYIRLQNIQEYLHLKNSKFLKIFMNCFQTHLMF